MSILPIRKTENQLSSWHPFEEIATIHERINQLFNRLGGEELVAFPQTWTPLMDVVENDKEITLKLDVPGMERKELVVEVDDGSLTIKGERKHEKKEEKGDYIHTERSYGSFLRRFPLPDYVDKEKIEATCKDGILNVSMTKIPGKKRDVKSIEIK